METKPRQTVPKSKSRGLGTTCFNCGKSYPHPDEYPCPAKGKTCLTYEKKNHFQSVCKNGPKIPPASATRNKLIRSVQHAATPIKQENSASSSSHYSVSSSEIVFGIHKMDISMSPKAKVKLNNHDIEMMINSGASIKIRDNETFEHIQGSKSPLQLIKSKDNVFAYGAKNHNVSKANKRTFKSHPKRGKLKYANIHLHIDEKCSPRHTVTQPARRVPLHIQKSLDILMNLR